MTWADGDALPKHINVEIFDDAAVESSEFFRIRLSNPTGGVTIRTRDEIVLIDDNDPSAPTLSLNKSIVAGCQSVTGRLQLASPAPAGGRVISISDTLPSATTPASVTVPAGSTTITFPIKTTPVTSLQSGTITATFGGTVLTRKLSVRRIGMRRSSWIELRSSERNQSPPRPSSSARRVPDRSRSTSRAAMRLSRIRSPRASGCLKGCNRCLSTLLLVRF